MLSRNRNEDSMMLERGVDVDHTTIQILLAKSKNAVSWVGQFRDETMRELFGQFYTLVLAYRALRSNKTRSRTAVTSPTWGSVIVAHSISKAFS